MSENHNPDIFDAQAWAADNLQGFGEAEQQSGTINDGYSDSDIHTGRINDGFGNTNRYQAPTTEYERQKDGRQKPLGQTAVKYSQEK